MSSLAFAPLLAAFPQGGQDRGIFFPPQASEAAAEHDAVFFLIFWIAAFFFALINLAALYFAIRYRRRRKGEPVEKSPSHNTKIELVWTIVPTVIVCYLFYAGMVGYVDRRTPPGGAYTVYVTGQKWAWTFSYPEGFTSNELHVPAGRAVKLVLGSNDVIHSVFIPAFRIKMDAVPGRYTETWFQSNDLGEYPLFCAEYCGTSHSGMSARVFVQTPEQQQQWVKEQTDLSSLPPVELGERLFVNMACSSCHSLDGVKLAGPPLDGVFGSQVEHDDGSIATADEAYLRESILNASARIVKGYGPAMPDFTNGPIKIKEVELVGLIEFLKSRSPQ